MNEKIKNECIRRMKILKLHDEGFHTCLGDFRKNEQAWKSEFYGILYWLDEEEKKIVKDFEEKYKEYESKVYHCYKAHTQFGEILYLFYCSNQADEDKDFDYNIKDNIIWCYAYNISDPGLSEFGTCYIRPKFGGVEVY